jgi:hypothetical protein
MIVLEATECYKTASEKYHSDFGRTAISNVQVGADAIKGYTDQFIA